MQSPLDWTSKHRREVGIRRCEVIDWGATSAEAAREAAAEFHSRWGNSSPASFIFGKGCSKIEAE